MAFRKKRVFLLTAVAVLLLLSILDVSIRKLDVFESFGKPFINNEKTEAYVQAKRGTQAAGQQQVEIERQAIREVALATISSHVTVQKALSSKIQLQVKVTAFAANPEEANRMRDSVTLNQQLDNGRLTLAAVVNGKPVDADYIDVDYVLLLPEGLKLILESRGGTVRIEGIQGDADVTADQGTLTEIIDAIGNYQVKASYGSLLMSGIQGSVKLENRSSDATIEDIQGPLTLNSNSGRTFLSRIAGKVTGDAKNGRVHIRDMAWPVELKGKSSALRLEHIRNAMNVISESGSVQLLLEEEEGYTLHATVKNGDIQTHLPFPIKRVDTGSQLNGVLGIGTWNVDVEGTATEIQVLTK